MSEQASQNVGMRLQVLRQQRGLSQRALADLCRMSPNAISLTERGISSPSISTLHQLASGLGVPITSFFEDPVDRVKVILTRAAVRSRAASAGVALDSLGDGLDEQTWDPFVVTLAPGVSIGRKMMAHSGHELIYCLEGDLDYEIDGERYQLSPGDALHFRADLPHNWRNSNGHPAVFLMLMTGADNSHEPVEQHLQW
jgi:transcriptional regulator with XRE-family HTH domain